MQSPSGLRAPIAAGRRKPSDFAIFYRVNALSRVVEQALRRAQVPYQMVRGQEFYARKEIKDVLAYCQLVNNPRDDIAFERTVNTPPRGIGKKTIDRLNEHAYRHGMPLLEAARDAALVEGLPKGDRRQGARVCGDRRPHIGGGPRGRVGRQRRRGDRHGARSVGLPGITGRERR